MIQTMPRDWRKPMRLRGRGVVSLAILLTALLCAAATARAATPLPPDLAALEQQMSQLHVNTERISFQEELSFGEFGSGIPFALIVTGMGEFSDSPPQGSMVAGILGLSNVQTRVIGNTVYTYRPQAGELDGGRPWVRSQKSGNVSSPSIDPSGITGSDQPGPQGTFSKLIEELNGALTIEESGPVTVEGQRAIEFDATLDPMPLLER